jgi:hypothetical protein
MTSDYPASGRVTIDCAARCARSASLAGVEIVRQAAERAINLGEQPKGW